MIALFSLIPIYGFALLFNLFAKRSVSVSIFFAISSIIATIFVLGMVDFLKYGTYFMFYGGIFAFIALSVIDYKKVLEFLVSIPSVIYIVTSVAYLYMMQDAQLFFWDEYSHWGPFIKEMYYFHHFYDASSVGTNLMYTPGISIWDYFVVLPTGFKEGSLYFAYFLVLFSSVLMMYEKLAWKQIHWIFLIFVMQMVVFATYGHWLSCIYVDHIVGAFVAGILLAYFTDDFKNKELIWFAIPLMTLVLFKEVGLYFSVVILGLVFILKIYEDEGRILERLKNQKEVIVILALLLVIVISTLKLWEMRQESTGLTKPAHSLSTLVKNIVSNKQSYTDEKKQEKYSEVFTDVVLNQQIHKEKVSLNYNEYSYGIKSKYTKETKLSVIGTYVFVVLSIVLLLLIVKNRAKMIIISSYLLLTSVLYLFILYLSMPLSFGDRALNMVSFVRYINTSLMPLLFITFALFVPLHHKKEEIQNYGLKNFIGLLSIIIVFVFITKPYIKPLYSQLENGFRKNVDQVVPSILKHIPKKSKVLVVFPVRNNGSLNNILRYSMIPTKSTVTKYDFFDKKTEKEVLEEFVKYDYIWFVSFNKNVIEKSRQILKAKVQNQPYTLYKLEKQNNQVQVKPIL